MDWMFTRSECETPLGTYYVCLSLGKWKSYYLGDSQSEPTAIDCSNSHADAWKECEAHLSMLSLLTLVEELVDGADEIRAWREQAAHEEVAHG